MNSELLDFVKFFRGTQYYTTAWDVNYTFGTTTPTIGAYRLAYSIAAVSAMAISLY